MKKEDVSFSREAADMLDKIAAIWPPIIRQGKKDKILFLLNLLARARKIKKADTVLVVEAARLVVPKSYDPLFHMFEDMEGFKKRMLEPFVSEAAYNKIPVRVRRWPRQRPRKKAAFQKCKNILAVCASPRSRGNTDMLIDEALRGAADAGAHTEKIMLHKINMGYCIGCRKCKEQGYEKICVINDDMTEIYQKIIDADALVIGFPIYTGRECAQLSTFLDRWDGYERYMLTSMLKPGRTALVIGTWGYPCIDTYDHVIENIISILNLHKVETVEALSACGFEGIRHGLDEKRMGVIRRHPEQLKKAYAAGRALAKY
ncbi:MAG: flavodoxin family protein [Deltaproteobacteria bacterium]|nr:flavodoxin family protein [Deltaproteobacteria bacterium]